ncbi:MAG: FHA domain-containing protein [Oligoflexia bacterium]|nr:FHA domain-containing protein [Oligoflexia bacterium]
MALLERDGDPKGARPLITTQVIGRAPTCRLHDADRHVSGIHAEIRWDGASWLLEDLGSRNGTWLDGQRLQARKPLPLQDGSVIAVGRRSNTWTLLTSAPPVALAETTDGAMVTAIDGVLSLPDLDDPQVVVYQTRDGLWVLKSDASPKTITSRHQVVVDQRIWTLYLPAIPLQTIPNVETAPSPRTAQLELHLGPGGHEANAWLMLQQGLVPVGARSSHQLLLLLAQARQHDGADGLPRDEQGWLHQDEMTQALQLTPNALHAAIHRLRNQFAVAGMIRAAGVIERRPASGMLRLGIHQVTIHADES